MKSSIPTWQWFQNSKVLEVRILKIEKEKISRGNILLRTLNYIPLDYY